MPNQDRLDDFIAMVVEGKHVEAIKSFYHNEASMQENLSDPRRGIETLVSHEETSLKLVKSIHAHEPELTLLDGDNVVINWTFDMPTVTGELRRLKEVSVQKWKGDRILEEQFFYDSKTAWYLVE